MSENVMPQVTTKQRKAIEALNKGAMVKEAAAAAGVTTRTLARWREQDVFKDAVRALHLRTRQDAARKLTGNIGEILDILLTIARDEMAAYSVRIRACQVWLDREPVLNETTELEARVVALEERFNEQS